MKSTKCFSVLFTLLFFSYTQYAQLSLGLKAGTNFADTRVDGLIGDFAPDQTTFTGYTFGVVGELPLKGALSFRPELNYIQKGFTVAQSFDVQVLGIEMPLGAKAKTRINYVELPLLLKYNIGSDLAKAYVIAGPSIGYAADAALRPVASLLIDINLPKVPINLDHNMYQRWEFSGVLGTGGEVLFGQGKFFADARYNLGLSNMLDNPVVDLRIKNQGFNISGGYAYTF